MQTKPYLGRALRTPHVARLAPILVAAACLLASPPAFATNPLAAGLDTTLTVTTSGDAPWFYETTETADGVNAVQSGPIGANQSTSLQATVTGPVYLSFKCKSSCEGYGTDYMACGVDGDLSYQVAGEIPWISCGPIVVPPGTHTFTWKYQKNNSVNAGSDCVYLDQLTTTPATSPANDNFANRINLGNTAPVTASGDNTFASLETGEDVFPALAPPKTSKKPHYLARLHRKESHILLHFRHPEDHSQQQ